MCRGGVRENDDAVAIKTNTGGIVLHDSYVTSEKRLEMAQLGLAVRDDFITLMEN
jgi:hypothetical protein